MKIAQGLLVFGLALSVGGCFTMYETPYPSVQVVSPGADREIRLELVGLETELTTYVPVYGYKEVLVPDPLPPPEYRHHHHHHHHSPPPLYHRELVSTTTMVPQTEASWAFYDRAYEALARAGFKLVESNAEFRVEIKFSGPFISDSDSSAELAWNLLSALTCDYGAQTWTAKLNVYDLSTGKLVHYRDFSQRHEVIVWSPFPLFGIAMSEKCTPNSQQCWCLSALTDSALAEVSAFLAGRQ